MFAKRSCGLIGVIQNCYVTVDVSFDFQELLLIPKSFVVNKEDALLRWKG